MQEVAQISSIFESKNWNDYQFDGSHAFDDFCEMLTYLEIEERKMILELTKNFTWISSSQYIELFDKAFTSLVEKIKIDKKRLVVICPALTKNNSFKSSSFLYYIIKSRIGYFQEKYRSKGLSISCVDSPNAVLEKINKEKAMICLVDDFIGSGETAEGILEFFVKNNYSIDSLHFISLVAMREGLSCLRNRGYNVFCNIVCDKGITGTSNENIWTPIMKSLESRIKVSDDYLFGYSHSEALVKMERTPNNTFPIYWLRNKQNPKAPFPRY